MRSRLALLSALLAAAALAVRLWPRRRPVAEPEEVPQVDPRVTAYVWVGDHGVATGGDMPPGPNTANALWYVASCGWAHPWGVCNSDHWLR